MNKNGIIDGIEHEPITKGDVHIVICDNRGLTMVGYCDFSGNDEIVRIRKARCVIFWGTKAHLGELTGGPLQNTRLGAPHTFDARRRHVVGSFKVNAEAWKGVLDE